MRHFSATLLSLSLVAATSAHGQSSQEFSSLVGVFTSAPDSPKTVGAQLTFTGLNGQEATMVWPDSYGKTMKKIFENQNLIILQSVGAVGSTDTVYLELKNKKFLVVSVGAMAIVLPGKSVTLSQYQGTLK